MKSIIKIQIISLLLLLVISCEKATNWEIVPNEMNFIVVNGLITNEKKEHQIILSHPVEQLNEIAEPISGAIVSIYDGDSLHQLTEIPTNSGIYNTDMNFRAFISKTYALLITVNGRNYYAFAYLLPVTPFNVLKYSYKPKHQFYTIDSVAQPFDIDEAAMYEISIDWRHVTGYDTIHDEEKTAIVYYYSLPTIDVSEAFKPELEKIYFPAGTQIIEKKYSLTPQHAEFIRSMLLATEWSGGLFDVAHANVKTNMSTGALGFFGGCTVVSKSFIVK
jgi:hypothetical protein